MKLSKWQLTIGATLVGVSIALYAIHYIIFSDLHHIVLWSFTSVAFLPISVLFVSMIIGGLLAQRDRRARLEKMNMVIGAFFMEVGNDLLKMLFGWDEDPGTSLKARCLSRGIISIALLGFRSLHQLPGESESSLRCLSSNRLFGWRVAIT